MIDREQCDMAARMVADDKGLLTIDESSATCNKRFAAHGIAQNQEMRRAYPRGCPSGPLRSGASSGAGRIAAYSLISAAATAHPLATQAGIDILKAGGSAVDASIAINACLGFLEPTSRGIGGVDYAMIWDPRQKAVVELAESIALKKPG